MIVLDGLQCSELTLEGGLTVYHPCNLNIHTLIGTRTHKIYLPRTKLTHTDGIAQMDEVMVNHILNDFLYVLLTLTT